MDFHESHPKRRGEDLFGLVVLLVSVFLCWQAWQIAGFSALSSPGAFPMAAAAMMVVAALTVAYGNLRNTAPRDDAPILPVTVALFTALVIVYAVLLSPLGFLPASLLFLFAGMRLLYPRGGWLRSGIIAVGALVLIYVIFRLVFQVVLPEGIVPEREILSGFGSGASEEAQ
jgi:putative tricarboxylic transport membrane protein